MLFTPEELGWIEAFTKALQEQAASKKWTLLLHHLVQLGIAVPGDCRCEAEWELNSWLHKNHVEYNRKVRAAIMATAGARDGLYKALYRDIHGPGTPEMPEYGRVALRIYGELLLDFLKAEPQRSWFREPYKPERLYQGGALNDQERNPGLNH